MVKDLKKYKRLFTFGCSFTGYIYPTWADILYQSMTPNIPFYNMGRAGGGNQFISSRLTEANRKYKFNEDDLVAVMWSTFARIDFFKKERGGWITPGNIYTQAMLSKQVVDELADIDFFMMRDLSLIELTHNFLKTLPCDNLEFLSSPFDIERDNGAIEPESFPDQVVELYKDLANEYPISVYEYKGRNWLSTISYEHEIHGDFIDYHPSPIEYKNYLLHCNVPLSQESIDYANDAENFLRKTNNTRKDIINRFNECDERMSAQYKNLW